MTLKLNEVHNLDCLVGLEKLDAGSVDLVFADPPFNIGYDYDVYDDKKDASEYLDWTKKWMTAVSRVLKPDGTFWLAIGDDFAAESKLIAQREAGFHCRSWVIWYYTFGVHCTKKFARSHTHLFHFVKNPKKFTFNDMTIRVPSARQLVYNDTRAVPDGRVPDDTWILRPQDLPEGFQQGDVWYFPRIAGTFKQRAGWHGCQMPEQLLARIIRVSSNTDERVVDPFAGSGTTLAVSKKLHREFIGFELSKEYAANVAVRLKNIKVGDPLDGAEDPLKSAPATPVPGKKRGSGKSKFAAKRRGSRPARASRHNQSLSNVAVVTGELDTAIVRAFVSSSNGYATDRVLADPQLNDEYQKACRDLKIPGDAAIWNHRLLALRKTGALAGMPASQRTTIASSDLDQYVFASEIALRIVSVTHRVSLDDILCDPELAKEFDSAAGRLAPGWSQFHYRWGALFLRKSAVGREHRQLKPLPASLRLDDVDRPLVRRSQLKDVPSGPGVYLLSINDTYLYAAHTFSLRDRLDRHSKCLDVLLEAGGQTSESTTEIQISKIKEMSPKPITPRHTLCERIIRYCQPTANFTPIGKTSRDIAA